MIPFSLEMPKGKTEKVQAKQSIFSTETEEYSEIKRVNAELLKYNQYNKEKSEDIFSLNPSVFTYEGDLGESVIHNEPIKEQKPAKYQQDLKDQLESKKRERFYLAEEAAKTEETGENELKFITPAYQRLLEQNEQWKQEDQEKMRNIDEQTIEKNQETLPFYSKLLTENREIDPVKKPKLKEEVEEKTPEDPQSKIDAAKERYLKRKQLSPNT